MDKKQLKELLANHAMLKKYLPDDFNESAETFFEFADFFYNVNEAMQDATARQLRKLVSKQYPDLAVVHPILEAAIDETNRMTMFGLAYIMKGLVEDMKIGTDIQAKYPKMEEWRAFYVHPKPNTMEGVERNHFLFPDEESWAKHVEEENKAMYRHFCWEENRKNEFYEIVQPALMQYYPVLQDIEGDFWVLYAVNLRDEYESWLSNMEMMESIVQYEMPPESINWEWDKYKAEKRLRYEKYGKASQGKRTAMIEAFEMKPE
jgi:hypothetical protein